MWRIGMIIEKRLQRTTPEAEGVSSSAIDRFLTAAQKSINELHSFMLLRHGNVVAEGWWSPYKPEYPHMLFSLSKSFTSTAIGLAVNEGRLTVDDLVLPFFPDEAPAEVSENLAAMRVRDLLSMSTGHAEDPAMVMRQGENWLRTFLAQPVAHAPGTHFVYNSSATYTLSAIIQTLTGQTLLDYLQPRLLQPLGTQGATWEMSPQGINTGGWGLNVNTEAIACFGQMYLQKGMWHGQQLMPEAWVTEATTRQISNGSNPESDWEQGYGYQFWRCRHGAYRGDGAFGQFCVVMPEQEAVLAITAGVKDMQAVLNVVWEHLLPALSGEPSRPADPTAHENLKQKLSGLVLLPPKGKASSPVAGGVAGKTYAITANDLKVETFKFDFAASECVVTIRNAEGEHRIVGGLGVWRENTIKMFPHSPRALASGVWADKTTFLFTVRFYETPFVYTLSCQFSEDRVSIAVTINVSFGPTEYSLAGQVQQ
jgi:CubicO group peptidase (beta-lactamase class C family)